MASARISFLPLSSLFASVFLLVGAAVLLFEVLSCLCGCLTLEQEMLKISSNRGSLDSSGPRVHACQTRSVHPFVRKVFNHSLIKVSD